MLQLNDLCQRFGRIDFREKRPGLYKVLVPFFHEDGDMYDIFVEEVPGNSEKLRISDYGLTLMKLSYTFDIDTENKQQVLESIIRQNRCDLDNGSIFLVIAPNQFEAGLRTPNKTEKQSKRQQGIKKPNGYQPCVHIGRAGACIDGTRQRFAQQPSGAFQDERNCPPHVWQCGALYVSRCTPVCKTENRTLYQREVSEDGKWVSRANFAGTADDPAYIPAFYNHSHWRQ